jgi:hypothetical protein
LTRLFIPVPSKKNFRIVYGCRILLTVGATRSDSHYICKKWSPKLLIFLALLGVLIAFVLYLESARAVVALKL